MPDKKDACAPKATETETEVSRAIDALNPHRRPTTPGVGIDAMVAREREIASATGQSLKRRSWLEVFLLSGAVAGHVALALEIFRRGW